MQYVKSNGFGVSVFIDFDGFSAMRNILNKAEALEKYTPNLHLQTDSAGTYFPRKEQTAVLNRNGGFSAPFFETFFGIMRQNY